MLITHHCMTSNCNYLAINKDAAMLSAGGYTFTNLFMFSYKELVLICYQDTLYITDKFLSMTTKRHINLFIKNDNIIYESPEALQQRFGLIMTKESLGI